MAYEHREGYGLMFQNDKQGNPNRPDWRGDFMVGGVVMNVSGWIKRGGKGDFISLKVEEKRDRDPSVSSNGWGGKSVEVKGGPEMPDDEIPF